jgi:hypothetical protein
VIRLFNRSIIWARNKKSRICAAISHARAENNGDLLMLPGTILRVWYGVTLAVIAQCSQENPDKNHRPNAGFIKGCSRFTLSA